MYVFDEIHNQVLSVMQRVRHATRLANPKIAGDALNREIDSGLMVAFPFIAKTLEDAQFLRTSVLAEQAARARAGKMKTKLETGNSKPISKREKALLELEELQDRLAKLEMELSKPEEPEPYHGVHITVNREGDLWRVRGVRGKRTTIFRDADLKVANKLAEAVDTLCLEIA